MNQSYETDPAKAVLVYVADEQDEAVTDPPTALKAMRAAFGDREYSADQMQVTDEEGVWRVQFTADALTELADNRHWSREADQFHVTTELD